MQWARAYQRILKNPVNSKELIYDEPTIVGKNVNLSDGAARIALLNNSILQKDLSINIQTAS